MADFLSVTLPNLIFLLQGKLVYLAKIYCKKDIEGQGWKAEKMCQQFLSVLNDTGDIVSIDTDDEFVISVKLSMMNALPVSITATTKKS